MADPDHLPHGSRYLAPSPDDLARRLRQCWEEGQNPDARQLLCDAGALSMEQVVAVLRVDQCQRWQRGVALPAEEYLGWFPELTGHPERALELVYGEYVLREMLGQAPQPAEYLRRFPHFSARLEQQLQLHWALESAGADSAVRAPGPDTLILRDSSSPDAAEPTVPAVCATPARYQIVDLLGRGGFGAVYQARDDQFGRDVAVKLLSERFASNSSAARRFLNEARITGQLQHPGIPAVHQVGALSDGRPFLVMKLIKGTTLEAILKDRTDVSVERGKLLGVFEAVRCR
jgi:hypothetical protein